MGLDFWLHVAELAIVVIIVPSLRQLIATLLRLHTSVELLAQQLQQHSKAFDLHVENDHANFSEVKELIERRTWNRRDADR